MQKKLKKTVDLEFSAREDRIQRLMNELSFQDHKNEIFAVIEMENKATKMTSKAFKNQDTFSSTVFKATMKFKRILRKVRERIAARKNAQDFPEDNVSTQEEQKFKNRFMMDSLMSESISNDDESKSQDLTDSDDSSGNNDEWRHKRSMKTSSDILIKPPTIREKSISTGTKIRLFDDKTPLSVIEEKSYANSKGSKMDIDSISGSVVFKGLSKEHSISAKSKNLDLTLNSAHKEVIGDTPSGASVVQNKDTLDFADQLIKSSNKELSPSSSNKSETTLKKIKNSKISMTKTFNIPKNSRNPIEPKKLTIAGTKKEIMGNSWINAANPGATTSLKRERSKLDLAELERQIGDLEAPMSIIEERAIDDPTNRGSHSHDDGSKYGSGLNATRTPGKAHHEQYEPSSPTFGSKFGETSDYMMGN